MSRDDSVLTALAATRRAFQVIDMPPPLAISLQSNDDGLRLMAELAGRPEAPRQPHDGPRVRVALMPLLSAGEADPDTPLPYMAMRTLDLPHGGRLVQSGGANFMEFVVLGMRIRWPAKRVMGPDGEIWY